jgi:3-oxoacyl-[acyl-carrier protein] reductase
MTLQKVAVVTGAARGIGAEIAVRLAADGAAVAVLARSQAGAADTVHRIRTAGGTATAVGADLSDPEQITEAFATVATDLGPPAILVNNAGVLQDGPLSELTVNDWDTVVDVNLRGPFLMCQGALPYLVEQRWGRIVNLSSVSALGARNQANYAAAKAGLDGLTRSLALELGPHGITVNVVAPGFVVTDMTAKTAARLGMDLGRLERIVAAQNPMRRAGRPEDIAHAVSFLAGEQAGYINGQVLFVTGAPAR